MELKKKFVMAAAAAMLATAANTTDVKAMDEKPVKPKAEEKENCYGIAKAGKNDCGWAGGSCHGSLTKDGDKTAYITLPKGLCERLVGGSLKSS
jgi:uncharacterized membrane protein